MRELVLSGLIGLGLLIGGAREGAAREFGDRAAGFFEVTNVHTVHLIVNPEAWDAMEPERRGFTGAGFGPGGGGRMNLGAAFEAGQGARPGLAGLMGLDFEYVKAAIEIDGERIDDVGLRYKGNGTYVMSQSGDKRPFKVDFNRYVRGQKFRGLSMLNLHNNIMDRTSMRETLGYWVAREAGLPAPRTTYARVMVTVPGRFERESLGLYTVTEQVNDDFLENWFGTRKGLLMKPGSLDGLAYRGDDWEAYERPLNVQENGSRENREKMIRFLKLMDEGTELESRIGEFVDLDNTALFLAMNVALVNLDSILSLGQNYYAYLEPQSGKLHWWNWDMDLSWGSFPLMGTPEERVELSITKPWSGENRFVERLLGVPEIRERYRASLEGLMTGVLAPGRVRERVDILAGALRPVIAEGGEEALRAWERAVSGTGPAGASSDSAPPPGGGFGMFDPPNYSITEFVERRAKSVADQLAGRAEGVRLAFGGGPGGPGARGGGGPGRSGAGGPPRLGPMMASPWLRAGDADGDRSLSADEFAALGARWFDEWDTDGSGDVTSDELRAGLDRSFGMPPQAAPFGGNTSRLRPNAPPPPGIFPGPGTFWAPVFLRAGDADSDGRLTREETRELFAKWRAEWNTDQDDALSADELGRGLEGVMPRFPGPGGPPQGSPPESGRRAEGRPNLLHPE